MSHRFRLVVALLAGAALAGCATVPAATKKNWKWVGAGKEPTVLKLIEQRETCRGMSRDETAIEGCMARAGWVRRREPVVVSDPEGQPGASDPEGEPGPVSPSE